MKLVEAHESEGHPIKEAISYFEFSNVVLSSVR